MEILENSNSITITGNIKSVHDFQMIKSSVTSILQSRKDITINIKDSLSITSSVIGYFTKLVLKDKVVIHLNIGNSELIKLLDDLNLSTLLNVKKALF